MCSPGKTMYKCSTLGRKTTQPHFHNPHLHHQHLASGGGGGGGGVGDGSDFMAVGGGGGSILGISMGTMRGGQFSTSTNELPLIIQMPMQMEPNSNNVPILNSILTTSSGHSNNNNNNNNSTSGSGGGSGGGAAGSTATLKKRVQIQEVTV